MTDLKLLIANLRKLASAATPGPWRVGGVYQGVHDIFSNGLLVGQAPRNDAEHIAACDPQTVLRLCDELEKAIEAIKEFEKAGTTLRSLVADESIRDVGKRIQDAATSFLNR